MPAYPISANVPFAVPGTAGGGEFTFTNLASVPIEGRELYLTDSANVDPKRALAVVAPGASAVVAGTRVLYAWSSFAGRVGVDGRAVNATDLNARYVLGAQPFLTNPEHLRARLGPKLPQLMGTPGGSGRGGITLLADGDSYMEGYASANDGSDAAAYGATSWVHILAELVARKLNPPEVAPNRRGTFRRPLATATNGRNPFGTPGTLLPAWNRTAATANWNGATVPIPGNVATRHLAEPHAPGGADVSIAIISGVERVLPTDGVTLTSDGTGGQCLIYRLEPSVTHVEIVYVRPPGNFGSQSITMDVFSGNVTAYPKGGGNLATGTFSFTPSGTAAAPLVTVQPVGDGAAPSAAKAFATDVAKTVVVHCGTAGPFGGYTLGFGLLAYSGNYDRGFRVVNLGVSGTNSSALNPTTKPTAFISVTCAEYSALSAGFYDAAGTVAGKGFGNLGLHLVGFGLNDSTGLTPAQFATNLNAIIDKDQSLPSAPATCLVWYPTGVFADVDRSVYRAVMQSVANARGVAMLDFGVALGDPNHAQAIAAGHVAPEGAHPSDLLHASMGFLAAQAILGALGMAL